MLFVRLGQIAAWYMLLNTAIIIAITVSAALADDPSEFGPMMIGGTIRGGITGATYSFATAVALGIAAHIGEMLTQIAENTRLDDGA